MINTRSSVRVRRSMTFPRGRVRSSLKKKKMKTKYNKNVPKRNSRSRKATFEHNDDPRSVIDNINLNNKDNNRENEEQTNTMDSTTSTTDSSAGVSVSDEDEDNHDHDHNDEYYYDNVDSSEEYDWTNKITSVASSSGNLMEDLEDIIRGANNNGQDGGDDCDSDWEEESTTGSITTATVIEVDLLDMNMDMDIIGDDGDKCNNLNDIFNHPEVYPQNKYTTMEEGKQEQDDDHKNHEEDHDVDLLDGSSFVVFGNDYPGSCNNTCCNNNDDDNRNQDNNRDEDDEMNNKQTMKIPDVVNNNVVRKHSHSSHPAIPVHVGPKTSRINPMIGERSFTDDIKQDEITTILSNNAPAPRRKYRKRKPKEAKGTTRSISHSYSLRRSIIASKEEEEERRKTAEEGNNISATSPPPICFDNDESCSSNSSPSATPPTCTTIPTRKPTRKRELNNLAPYNKVPHQEKKKQSKPIVKANKQDSKLLSSANTTTRSEYELQSSSYSYFTHGENHHLPRRIAKKFLYRPTNNNLNSDKAESCTGNVRSKPFFGTVIVKGLQQKQDDYDRNRNGRRMSNNTNNKTVVWYVVYDDGDEDIFDEIEYQKAIDQYERLKRWDTNGTDIITSIQHAWG